MSTLLSDSSVKTITHPSGVIDVKETIGDLSNLEFKSVGIILWLMAGDILGAPVEAKTSEEIEETHGEVRNFKIGKHLGASELGFRFGLYTDDTQTSLVLANSLISEKALNAKAIAFNYAHWARQTTPKRGYPPSAESIHEAILKDPSSFIRTGTMDFPEGKYSNGAAMRISSLAVVYRNSPAPVLRKAVGQALISTHVHPSAVDGATLFCLALCRLIPITVSDFDPKIFLKSLISEAISNDMISNLVSLQNEVDTLNQKDDVEFTWAIGECLLHQFQIRCVDAVTIAFYFFLKYFLNPEEVLIKSISPGGDTDTIAALCGALVGALYGPAFLPNRWYVNMENGPQGRDYAVRLYKDLCFLPELEINELKK